MVIFQEIKCLCHVRKWLPCFPCGLLTLAKETSSSTLFKEYLKQEVVSHPVNEWNIGSARDVLGPRKAQAEFRLMYWKYFLMPKPIQMAADGHEAIMSWKSPFNMTSTSVSTVRTKSVLAAFVQRVLNMYSNSCVGFFVVASLHTDR